jgi:hypothetical protein
LSAADFSIFLVAKSDIQLTSIQWEPTLLLTKSILRARLDKYFQGTVRVGFAEFGPPGSGRAGSLGLQKLR